MSTPQIKILSAGLLFVLIFLSGFWLSRSGKPYPTLLFTLHKLIALGALVFLIVTVSKLLGGAPLGPVHLAVVVIAALCFVATMLTGGLLSIDKSMPPIVHRLHQVAPYLTLLSTAAALYLLLGLRLDLAAG